MLNILLIAYILPIVIYYAYCLIMTFLFILKKDNTIYSHMFVSHINFDVMFMMIIPVFNILIIGMIIIDWILSFKYMVVKQ